MDDDLVLNLAEDEQGPSLRVKGGKKGGKWTDRLKAKRVTKRKARSGEGPAPGTSKKGAEGVAPRPAKRSRVEHVEGVPKSRPPTQIISSLFSRNPEVEAPLQTASPKTPSKPSNAPLDLFSFAGLGLDPLITAHLNTKMNILKPTSIQRAVLSLLLSNQTEERANRDVFIQSQTGSGKTLAYLLPIIEDLLPLSSHSYIDRSIGTLAIVIAPTRELAKQISEVLEALLTLRLRADGEKAADPAPSTRRTRWLVSGLLVGGATRTHEKARLRKGVPILVSTPGRLLDHLQNTSSFNVGKCRWLVLDEADRLMELGFEETITGIVKGLDGRRRLAMHAVQEGTSTEVGGWDWSRRRRVILCSATMREDVQKLAGTVLVHPMMIKATESDALSGEPPQISFADGPSSSSTPFTPPSQLAQKYVIVPLKLRLVALIALLRSLLAQSRRDCKIIVFFSCTDSVDFHWHLLGGSHMGDEDESESATSDAGNGESGAADVASPKVVKTGVKSSLLPEASIFRLHGSLPTATRLASLKDFTAPPPGTGKTPTASASSILLCTSVASRGLDLPLVRAVVQYDLPTEGGSTEYVHRVGRTARAGKGGEAWSIVAPSEALWVKWVEGKMQGEKTTGAVATDEQRISLNGATIESVLAKGFGGKGTEYEARATEVQLAFERWVLHRKEHAEVARQAFLSHVRAYATHPSAEKHIFHIRHLHLGHLAKAFALREAPTAVTGGGSKSQKNRRGRVKGAAVTASAQRNEDHRKSHEGDAEQRMQKVVRSQGSLLKKGGIMMSSGTSEFQLASGADLEKLAMRSQK